MSVKQVAYCPSVNNTYTRGFPAHLDEYRIENEVLVHMAMFSFNAKEVKFRVKIVVPGENEFKDLDSVFDLKDCPDDATNIVMAWAKKENSPVVILGSYYVKGEEVGGFDCISEAKRK